MLTWRADEARSGNGSSVFSAGVLPIGKYSASSVVNAVNASVLPVSAVYVAARVTPALVMMSCHEWPSWSEPVEEEDRAAERVDGDVRRLAAVDPVGPARRREPRVHERSGQERRVVVRVGIEDRRADAREPLAVATGRI